MDIQEDSSSSSNCVYEQDEVVWAKIRGYPWWPGYVTYDSTQIGEINAQDEQEIVYKVYFFGDCSHSHLNSQKIRKFESYFPEYSIQAKKNYKLKLSLLSAKQLLEQNKEDVSFFDIFNNEKINNRKNSISKDNIQISEKQKQQNHRSEEIDKKIIEPENILGKKRGRGRPKKISMGETLDTEKKESSSLKQEFHQQRQRQKSVQLMQEEIISLNSLNMDNNIHEGSQSVQLQQNQQICELSQLIGRGEYEQALRMLLKLNITSQNVIKLLNLGITSRLSDQVDGRHMHKIKLRLKKQLIQKYFQSNSSERKFINLSRLRYNSARGKTVRKIYKILKFNHQRGEKKTYLALQSKIRQTTFKNDRQYKKQIINLMRKVGTNSSTNFEKFFHELNEQR